MQNPKRKVEGKVWLIYGERERSEVNLDKKTSTMRFEI